jgi:hypothetical protein
VAVYQSLTNSYINVSIRCWFLDGVGVDVALLLGWNVECAFLTREPAINQHFPTCDFDLDTFEVAQYSTTASLIPGISSSGPLIHHEHSIQLFYSPALCIHTTHRSANTRTEGNLSAARRLLPRQPARRPCRTDSLSIMA